MDRVGVGADAQERISESIIMRREISQGAEVDPKKVAVLARKLACSAAKMALFTLHVEQGLAMDCEREVELLVYTALTKESPSGVA